MRRLTLALAACLLAGCHNPPPETARQQTARLRASFEQHRTAYLRSVEDASRLVPETLAWLDGPAVSHSRAIALSEARTLTDNWARIYFVPRTMHGQLRFDRYTSQPVQAAQQRVLDLLRRSYFELHEYQRYCQYAAESGLHAASPGRLPPQLEEFRRRLRAHLPSPTGSIRFSTRSALTLEALLTLVGGSARTPASASGTAP